MLSSRRYRDFASGPAAKLFGSRGSRDSGHARPLPKPSVSVDSIADVQDELRGRTRDSCAVWHVIERPFQLRVFLDVLADFLKIPARRLETLLEFRFGFYLGLAERHLHATVRVNFAFARSLDG